MDEVEVTSVFDAVRAMLDEHRHDIDDIDWPSPADGGTPCWDFAPDSLGPDAAVCIRCLWFEEDHRPDASSVSRGRFNEALACFEGQAWDRGFSLGAAVEHRIAVDAVAQLALTVLGKDRADGIIDLGALGSHYAGGDK